MAKQTIQALITREAERQADQLTLIPSENYASKAVMEAEASVFMNKYAEGYPAKRYYAGNRITDELEETVGQLAQEVFNTDYHVNVQPYSGSPANLAAYMAVLQPGDTVMGMNLAHGGHLTHGHSVSATGKLFNFIQYGVDKDSELIDYQAVREQAKTTRPKLIVCGATAYPALFDFQALSQIAQEVGALLMADISHIAGLIVGKEHPSPFGLADIVTTTTHKTLRGPRAGVIFCKPDLAVAVDKAVFPGLQGGPHLHTIAAMGIAFSEALQSSFTVYAHQMVLNAKALAYALQQRGLRLVGSGTDTHLMLVDLNGTGLRGQEAQILLEEIGLITNKNTIPFDPHPPMNPSGLRLGTPAVTSRGMKEKEMEELADIITEVLTKPDTATDNSARVRILAKKFRIPSFY